MVDTIVVPVVNEEASDSVVDALDVELMMLDPSVDEADVSEEFPCVAAVDEVEPVVETELVVVTEVVALVPLVELV